MLRDYRAGTMTVLETTSPSVTRIQVFLVLVDVQRKVPLDLIVTSPAGLNLPLPLLRPRPLDEAISSAGGLACEMLDAHLMLRDLPGTFCAGEMIDWEAPTGGYLLTACLATGHVAGQGAAQWLRASAAVGAREE